VVCRTRGVPVGRGLAEQVGPGAVAGAAGPRRVHEQSVEGAAVAVAVAQAQHGAVGQALAPGQHGRVGRIQSLGQAARLRVARLALVGTHLLAHSLEQQVDETVQAPVSSLLRYRPTS